MMALLQRVVRRVDRELNQRTDRTVRGALTRLVPTVMHASAIFPHDSHADTYTLPAYAGPHDTVPGAPYPVPPKPLWANYCSTPESYLQSGLDDMTTMRRVLRESGFTIEDSRRVLELGVAGGRLLRHLADLTPKTQLWGVDPWATAVLWCQEHLPFAHFATTTVTPHLPFEDRSCDLVFAGSVFTHIDDLVDAWFLELHRIIRPGGRLYFSINDRAAVQVFNGGGKDRARYIDRITPKNWQEWLDLLASHEGYQRFARGEAQMVTMGRGASSHVLWDADYLLRKLAYGWRRCSVTPEAYGHQTCVTLERR